MCRCESVPRSAADALFAAVNADSMATSRPPPYQRRQGERLGDGLSHRALPQHLPVAWFARNSPSTRSRGSFLPQQPAVVAAAAAHVSRPARSCWGEFHLIVAFWLLATSMARREPTVVTISCRPRDRVPAVRLVAPRF